uniref:ATP synthase F0 subunit 8 n=1 Tax=Elysia ornata TaxID=305967 RepID=A0A342KD17_9GAST|nr:ATP synthase F0 subunit 8 [Elysia ornata]ANI87287.1 ATP synthase F0 subunit 8 [Elysia ornata]
MPQLSPMLGILVFALTNLAFLTLLFNVRSFFNSLPLTANKVKKTSKTFRVSS